MKCAKCGHTIPKGVPCRFCLRIKQAQKQSTLMGKLRHKFRTAKYRCKRDGIEFGLVWESFSEWALNAGYPLLWEHWQNCTTTKEKRDNTPSLDRLDNSKGYFIENLQWTTWRWNWQKEQNEQYHARTFGDFL